jgi:hypothetical protein
VVALVAIACSGAVVVAQQIEVDLQGRVIQRSDGTLYVVKDGIKYRIQLTQVDDDVIDLLPEADFTLERLDQLFGQPAAPEAAPVAAPVPVFGGPSSLPAPYIAVANPNPGDTVQPGGYNMQGKAFDPAALFDQGTGIDRVDVFLGDRDRGAAHLGSARLARPNPAAAPGTQFALAGWEVQVYLPPGAHTLVVYAHSTVTDKEGVARVPIRVGQPS